MSRTLKRIVTAALAWMVLVSLALLAWKGWTPEGPDPTNLHRRLLIATFFMPLWLVVPVLIVGRRLRSDRPRLSDSHHRFLEVGLVMMAGLALVIQGYFAGSLALALSVDNNAFQRIVVLFMGVYVAVRGNFAAKLDPPTGDGAPEPAVWTRNLMRFGWASTVGGLAMAVCAIALPPAQVIWVNIAGVVLIGGAEIRFRQRTRQRV